MVWPKITPASGAESLDELRLRVERKIGMRCRISTNGHGTTTVATATPLSSTQEQLVRDMVPGVGVFGFHVDPGMLPTTEFRERLTRELPAPTVKVDAQNPNMASGGRVSLTAKHRGFTSGQGDWPSSTTKAADVAAMTGQVHSESWPGTRRMLELKNAVSVYTPWCEVRYERESGMTIITTDRVLTAFEQECMRNVVPECVRTFRVDAERWKAAKGLSTVPIFATKPREGNEVGLLSIGGAPLQAKNDGELEALSISDVVNLYQPTDENKPRFVDECTRELARIHGVEPIGSAVTPSRSDHRHYRDDECAVCQQPFNAYRKQAVFGWRPLCGDHAGNVEPKPLDARIAEAKPPEPERRGPWMGPSWDEEW